MPKPIVRKWWVGLVQGIILIILSIYIFYKPLDAMKGISVWIGLLILFTGLVGTVTWFSADKRENTSLLWSILTIAFGLVMLLNLFAASKIVTILFGLWMVFLGLHFIESGLVFMKHKPFRWVTVFTGVLCIVGAGVLIFGWGTGMGVNMFIGVQILFAGIALVIFAFVKKEAAERLMDRAGY